LKASLRRGLFVSANATLASHSPSSMRGGRPGVRSSSAPPNPWGPRFGGAFCFLFCERDAGVALRVRG